MKIASQKRKENVAEYVLFMWQLTDLLRSLKFDEALIKQHLIAPLNLSDEEAAQELDWYVDLCRIIKQEGKESVGFISITEYLVNDLYDFHVRLANEPKDDAYKLLVFNATPALSAFKSKVADTFANDIFYAFYALYSQLLMKMRKTEVSKQTQESFTEIARMIGYLASRYRQFEDGTFSFTDC